jgi:hypothetical protein
MNATIGRLFAALVVCATLLAGAAWAAGTQKAFSSPADAARELAAAAKAGDIKAMLALLGPGAREIVSSGDPVADRAYYARFAKAYDEANKIEMSGDAKAVLSVGKDAWPMPIPILKTASGWRFDAKQASEEILNRRIGRNELSVIQAAQAYVDAQKEYYLRNPAQDKLLHYAQNFFSTKGRRDGLYYPTGEAETPSPLGELYAKAQAAGYRPGGTGMPEPYYGYYYRILKSQGPDAKGGAYDYVAKGRMVGGFALLAYPAAYGNSGIMTFVVNHDGVVYEKDLGPETVAIAAKIVKFNPDATWKVHK